MKTFTFDLNKHQDFIEIAHHLDINNVSIGDQVIFRINAKTNMEFNLAVSKIMNQPFVFCQFIDACRTAVSGKQWSNQYIYPQNKTIYTSANEIARCLTENTKINFTIERIGNEYSYKLPVSGLFNEVGEDIFTFFISNSVMPGDTVSLSIEADELNSLVQAYYFNVISSAIKVVAEQNSLPSNNLDLSNIYFEHSGILNSTLAERLSASGIKFTLSN